MDKDECKELLKVMTCTVSFVKVNGDRRDMECTLDPMVLPTPEVPEVTTEQVKKVNENVLPVWDTQKEAWRSFRLNSVIKVTTQVPHAGETVLWEKNLED